MAHHEEVEDLRDLDSTLPRGIGCEGGDWGELVLPSDVGKVPLVTPAPTCAGEDPKLAVAPTGGDTSVVAGEPAVEDPAASAGPSQVVG
jgi:hypothetical protein